MHGTEGICGLNLGVLGQNRPMQQSGSSRFRCGSVEYFYWSQSWLVGGRTWKGVGPEPVLGSRLERTQRIIPAAAPLMRHSAAGLPRTNRQTHRGRGGGDPGRARTPHPSWTGTMPAPGCAVAWGLERVTGVAACAMLELIKYTNDLTALVTRGHPSTGRQHSIADAQPGAGGGPTPGPAAAGRDAAPGRGAAPARRAAAPGGPRAAPALSLGGRGRPGCARAAAPLPHRLEELRVACRRHSAGSEE